MTLRNSVDDIAIEKQYHLYSPLVKEIKVCPSARRTDAPGTLVNSPASRTPQVLKYQRARRAKLYYLRDRPARDSYVNPKSYGLQF